jgi:hypothetical protein
MPIELLTIADLQQFKTQLIQEIKLLLSKDENNIPKVLKTRDVCKLLFVSAGTLQNWRKEERVGYTKIGGTIFYAYEDVVKLFKERQKRSIVTLSKRA